MPRLIITQETVTGGDDDGSRDGQVAVNQDPAAWTDDYRTENADLRPGFFVTGGGPTPGGSAATIKHWLRFKVPLEYDADITIDAMWLKLWWNPADVDPLIPGHAPLLANDGLEDDGGPWGGCWNSPIGIYLKLYSGGAGADAPIPSDVSNFISMETNMVSPSLAEGAACDHWLNHDPGERVESNFMGGTDLAELFQTHVYSAANWAADNHILIALDPTYYTRMDHRMAIFRSWSWLKWRIGRGELDASAIDTAPQLIIDYTMNTPGSTFGEHVEHNLDIWHTADEHTHHLKKTVEHTLAITDEHSIERDWLRVVEDELTVLHAGTWQRSRDYDQTLQVYVALTQEITAQRVKARTIEHDLTLDQTLEVQAGLNRQVVHDLDITDENDAGRGIDRSIEHTINFSDENHLAGTKEKESVSVLTIEQDISTEGTDLLDPVKVEHTLTFEEWFGSPALTPFVDSKTPGRDAERSIASKRGQTPVTGGMHDMSAAFSGGKMEQTIAHDPLGDEDSTSTCERPDLTDQRDSAETLTETGSFVLEFPKTSPTDTVTLPPPVLGNREELTPQRIQRKSRGGELLTFRDSNWPEDESYRYQFEDLTESLRDSFFAFVVTSLGQEVKVTDHEGRSRIGVITNPSGDSVQNFRDCGFTIEFTLLVSPQ